jgi:hypothetical protein
MPMVGYLMGEAVRRTKVDDRESRLFAAACCRGVWHLLADARSRAAVEVVERYADGLATEEEICEAAAAAWDAADGEHQAPPTRYAAQAVYAAAGMYDDWGEVWDAWRYAALAREGASVAAAALPDCRQELQGAWVEAHLGSGRPVGWGWSEIDVEASAVVLIREIFGNPFQRQLCLGASLRQGSESLVVTLARAAYEERSLPAGTLEPARLAVLADALEEGDCAAPDLLGHLRGPGPHVRGCWALDCLLATE